MKLTVVVEVLLLCVILTLCSLVTIDSVTVRKAELTSVLAVDVQNVVADFFEGEIDTANLQDEVQTAIKDYSHSISADTTVVVTHASSDHGIVDLTVEVSYKQLNGRPRMLTYRRVYIKETPADPEAANQYSFIRTIDESHYKIDKTSTFVPEIDGGLKEDSIWRTEDYEQILDKVFRRTP